MKKPQTIGEAFEAAFALSHEAKKLANVLVRFLPKVSGRNHAAGHRIYLALTELGIAFD